MPEPTQGSVVVNAPAGHVIDVVADLATYPEWSTGITQVEVLSTEGDGWVDQVRFVSAAGPLKDTYTLDFGWDVTVDGTGRVTWSLVSGSILSALDAGISVGTNPGGGTLVEHDLTLDTTSPIVGMLKRRAERSLVSTFLSDLKRRVEDRHP